MASPCTVAAVVAGLLVASCGAGDGEPAPRSAPATSPCGSEVSEPLDASTSLHLLPGAPQPSYLSDPPTSGPHLSGPAPSGALTAPLDRPTQVQVLEQGGIVIQHRDLDDSSRQALEGLAGDQVVVAPNPTLPAPVVATAWLTKLECTAADVSALRAFIDAHQGQGPEGRAGD